jgi:hypothetical protein
LIIIWPKTMLYGRDIDCNLLFWPGYYTNAEPSGPNDDQGRTPAIAQEAVSGSVIVSGDNNVQIGRGGVAIGRGAVAAGAGGIAVGGNVSGELFINEKPPGLLAQDQAFERIGAAVRSNLSQLELNIEKARLESGQFFKLTLIFASLGFIVVGCNPSPAPATRRVAC